MPSLATLYILSAPSGAGKTSLVKALTEKTSSLTVSVSHTTRKQRPGEEDGKDYFFVDHNAFEATVADAGFLEYAQVFDNYYGTTQASVFEALEQGTDVILEIDWQGAQQVRKAHPETVSIFILPPSLPQLEQRLRGRGQDSESTIQRRMKDAVSEMQHHAEFDYLVINDDFQLALAQLSSIIEAGRLTSAHQRARHTQLIHSLIN